MVQKQIIEYINKNINNFYNLFYEFDENTLCQMK